MRVAIAGGGTGGHLFPALAVGEILRAHGHEVLIFISEKDVDALAIHGRTEFRFEKLPSIGMPALFSPAMLTFFQRFNASLAPCRKILADFKPDAVLGMGGFTSTPPILAGKFRRVPTFVHESNAIPGKANRFNGRLVDVVLLGFKECGQYFQGRRCEVTGTPIRGSLIRRIPRAEALASFGLRSDRTTVLVMGGSQGAHGINEAVCQAIAPLKEEKIQFIHLTGPQDDATTNKAFLNNQIPAHVAAFCHEMEFAYSAADLVIARSGAASLAEISHFGLPSILIPYPNAAENHQHVNAEIFARAGAATLLKESETTGEKLAKTIRAMLGAQGQLRTMGDRSRSLASDDAATRVVEVIESTIGTR